ncbi:MAG TPA: NAD-dependent epimerase/dehydratase family protein [Gaiellaceae bacterium]
MGRALLLGGTGQIGRAAAARLAGAGWEVVVAARGGPMRVDRTQPGELEAAVGDGVDVLVDIVAFTRGDGEQLNALAGRVGSLVVISSASVYADDAGRTLDEASSVETFPRFPLPIPETQPTVAPSDETYSTQKAALEQTVLDGPLPATVIRPCAIYGVGSELPRELFFLKRVLDGRTHVVLTSNGESRFHTTSVENIAELVRLAAERPGDRVLNCGDPEPPTTSEIGRAVAPELEQAFVPESGYGRRDLSNPWAVPFPLVVDMRKARDELGYEPVTGYAHAVQPVRKWLLAEASRRDWTRTYLGKYFDYAAEDEVLGSRS